MYTKPLKKRTPRTMALAAAALYAGALAAVAEAGQGPGFAPGWNGLAELPPMGWRHWNAFGGSIRAGLPGDGSNCSSPTPPHTDGGGHGPAPPAKCGSIARNVDLLTKKQWAAGGGKLASLADFGYTSVGIDEGWEACGFGVNGSGHHDASGHPLVNKWKFPDMQALTAR